MPLGYNERTGPVRDGRARLRSRHQGVRVQQSSLVLPTGKAEWGPESGAPASLVPALACLFWAKSGAPPLAFSRLSGAT